MPNGIVEKVGQHSFYHAQVGVDGYELRRHLHNHRLPTGFGAQFEFLYDILNHVAQCECRKVWLYQA